MGIQITYTFPGGKQGQDDVTVRELTVDEQMMVGDAKGDRITSQLMEMAARSIVKIRGVEVTGENRDEVWRSLSAIERDLVFRAYRKLHAAGQEEQDAFFASAHMKAGA